MRERIDYSVLTDEQIIDIIHNGDKEAQDYLINKYKNFVKIKSRAYFLIGADREDIIQEGMIGLYKAIRDYKKDKKASFYSFAELCITRQIITAIKTATRQKHMPLNSYVSLSKTIDDETVKSYIDLIVETNYLSPEEILIGREERKYIEELIAEDLSELEHKVLYLYLQGKSYTEIAKIYDRNEKSIDNALQRIKKKVEKILEKKNLTGKTKYANI